MQVELILNVVNTNNSINLLSVTHYYRPLGSFMFLYFVYKYVFHTKCYHYTITVRSKMLLRCGASKVVLAGVEEC